jgi:hypothetical protein
VLAVLVPMVASNRSFPVFPLSSFSRQRNDSFLLSAESHCIACEGVGLTGKPLQDMSETGKSFPRNNADTSPSNSNSEGDRSDSVASFVVCGSSTMGSRFHSVSFVQEVREILTKQWLTRTEVGSATSTIIQIMSTTQTRRPGNGSLYQKTGSCAEYDWRAV